MSAREKHTAVRGGKRLLWYTERLWDLSKDLEPFDMPLEDIAELDRDCWFHSKAPTMRDVANHAARIEAADLNFPIILNDDGSLMDGGHRLCKALINGERNIRAVRFQTMPEPDEVIQSDA